MAVCQYFTEWHLCPLDLRRRVNYRDVNLINIKGEVASMFNKTINVIKKHLVISVIITLLVVFVIYVISDPSFIPSFTQGFSDGVADK